jgi:hypothetical protein
MGKKTRKDDAVASKTKKRAVPDVIRKKPSVVVPLSVPACAILHDRREQKRQRKQASSLLKEGKKKKKNDEEEAPAPIVKDVASKIQRVRYNANAKKNRRVTNVFNGKSGEGFCYRFGVIRKGGPAFMSKLQSISLSFLMELLYMCVRLCATKKKSIVSPEMVCAVSQSFGITAVF